MAEITLKEAKQMLKQIRAKARLKYSTNEFVRLGEKRYEELKDRLEPRHKRKFIVIEVESGDFFIDKDSVKATLKAQEKYPDTVFYMAKIGYPAAFSMKGNVQLL